MDKIIVKGAKEHNLKSIDIEIPRDKLVVITGVSGSGKSSLAFDTIYAEGQRRYVESLSAYARQFLEQVDKPDVESIEGLSPSISIEQKSTSKNPRSTVGTVTEVYDYLRLLFARIGRPHCYNCSRPITAQTIEQMADTLVKLEKGTRLIVLSPIVTGRKGEYKKELDRLRKEGYTRVRINGEVKELDSIIVLDKRKKQNIDVIVDRLVLKDSVRRRLTDSLEIATRLSDGIVKVDVVGKSELLFNEKLSCIKCSISYPEINPTSFSFNSPYGACKSCKGLGNKFYFDPELVIEDTTLSLSTGAVAAWSASAGKKRGVSPYYLHILEALAAHYSFDMTKKWNKLTKQAKEVVLYGTGDEEIKFKHRTGRSQYAYTAPFEGVLANLERRYHDTESEDVRTGLEKYMNSQTCPECEGARLKKEALSIKVGGKSIWEIVQMSIKKNVTFFAGLKLTKNETEIGRRILKEISERLGFLANVGLEYITLERSAGTLSGGEGQRIRLATQIGSSLVGVLYILDEPSIGLHQRDNRRLLGALTRLRDMGNTVIIVEHDEETMFESDHIIDMGPEAGERGGRVVAEGTVEEILKDKNSLTGKYLSGRLKIPVPTERRKPGKKKLSLKGMRENNLKNLNVDIPIGLMTCVTGVSGSGKSTFVIDTLYKSLARALYHNKERPGLVTKITGLEYIDKVIAIDQTPIGRTPRSNPSTYTGLFTPIRELFSQLPESRVRGYTPGRFSFNVKGGRCEACKGDGLIKVEMHFLPDVYVTCEVCEGARYNRDTLEIRFRGKNITDCLNLTVTEGLAFFENIPPIREKLSTLATVGLGYIRLGQPSTTLSGGEAQRIKLSKELSKRATGKTIYILDEPTTGLHFADIHKLLDVLKQLSKSGNTIIIIEHNLDVIKSADYVIDLGPEGGDGGGEIVAVGTPEEVAATKASYTGQFLQGVLS